MKYTNTVVTILAIMILVGVGYHLHGEKNKNKQESEKTYMQTVENTDGTETVIESEYPVTESFSNKESNEKNTEEKKVNRDNHSSYNKFAYTPQPKKPFIFGTIFPNTIKKYGIDECTLNTSSKEEEQNLDYSEDNLNINKITIAGRIAYLFAEADKKPEKTCAEITVFKTIFGESFDAVFLAVE